MESKPVIKHILSDFFGVLSSEVAPFWFIPRFGLERAREIHRSIFSIADRGDMTGHEAFLALSEVSGEPWEKIWQDWYDLAHINLSLIEFLNSLKPEIDVTLLSNATSEYLRRILNSHSDVFADFFVHEFISAEIGLVKPMPEIFAYALKTTGFKAEECLFIDDNPNNVKAAEAMGIKALVFTDTDNFKEDFKSLIDAK